MKKLKFLVFFIIPTLIGCPEISYKHGFMFSNNSDIAIYIYFGVAPRSLGGALYPDTAVAEVRCGVPYKKGETRYYDYNYVFNKGQTDTLSLFIFDADTFNTYSWDEIKNGYKILKRYDLSPQDLQQLNQQITYPPDERMKDMKMYPPYGSE